MNTARQLLVTLEAQGVSLSVRQGKLKVSANAPPPPDLLEATRAHRDELIGLLSVPRLPWQLERLVSAASSDSLDATVLGVSDVGRYVMGWACAYLTGDRDEALARLWQVYRAWQGVN